MDTSSSEREPTRIRKVDDMQRIRDRFSELMSSTDLTPQLMEASLLGIVGECQKLRQKELKGAENLERQANASRAKAEGFSLMASIVYNVVNGFAIGAEKMKAEEEELAEIDKVEEPIEEKPAKKRRGRKKKDK